MKIQELMYRIRESWYYTRKKLFDLNGQNFITRYEGKKQYIFWNN